MWNFTELCVPVPHMKQRQKTLAEATKKVPGGKEIIKFNPKFCYKHYKTCIPDAYVWHKKKKKEVMYEAFMIVKNKCNTYHIKTIKK